METGVETSIAERLKESFLRLAQQEGRYSAQKTEIHLVTRSGDGECCNNGRYNVLDYEHSQLKQSQPTKSSPPSDEKFPDHDVHTFGPYGHYSLRCVLQRSRPMHVSGRPDSLPFKNSEAMSNVFRSLGLPATYFQIADGSAATVYSCIDYTGDGNMSRYELIAHILTKQGNWAMALSHEAKANTTSVFWSVDSRIDSALLKEDLFAMQDYAFHLVLIPCIMLAATLRMAIQRRHSIKERLDWIEKELVRISEEMAAASKSDQPDRDYVPAPGNAEELFALLNSCKKDQESRKGLYSFWNSFNEAIEEGFNYAHTILDIAANERHHKAQSDLRKWKTLTWQRIKSIMARDEDHNDRVDNVSYTLYTLNQQREITVQSRIAQAAQRDSEDMKFIAVLGSIFLPASLVATILNVPEFQFLPGASLFGDYVAITLPLIALVVALCVVRKYRPLWERKPIRPPVSTFDLPPLSPVEPRRSASVLQRQLSFL